MPITAEAATQAVRAAVASAAGVAATLVRVGNADPVAGSSAYYVVTTITDQATGYPTSTGGIGATALTLRQTREASLQILGVGQGTQAKLQALVAHLLSPRSSIAIAFRAAGCSVIRFTGPRDMSAFYETGTEPRFTLDITIQYVLEVTASAALGDVDAIEVDLYTADGGFEADPAVVVPDV